MNVTKGGTATGPDTGALAMVGRLVASEAAAVSELTPDPVPDVEAMVSAEVEALGGDALDPDRLVEAEASLRVLLVEHDIASVEATDYQRSHLDEAAETLRHLAPEVDLEHG